MSSTSLPLPLPLLVGGPDHELFEQLMENNLLVIDLLATGKSTYDSQHEYYDVFRDSKQEQELA